MLPDAPGLFSTTTGWPSARDNGSTTRRAVKSVEPPGAVGTTSVIGRCGYLPWAKADGLASKDAPLRAASWARR
jgi:hypothetical protein